MASVLALATALFAAAIGKTPAAAQRADTVEVTSYRFFMPDGMTLVDGFVRIPFATLTPLAGGFGGTAAVYRLALSVTDDSGVELTNTDWTGTVPQHLLNTSGASTVEHFAFAIPQGGYSLTVTVTDSASGLSVVLPSNLEAFPGSPLASDLFLTNALRRTTGESDRPAPGEIQKGAFFISGTPRAVLQPTDANLFYYLELYPGAATTLTSSVRILAPDGRQMFETPPSTMSVSERGGVVVRSLNVTGLPPGDYSMAMEVSTPDTSFTRAAVFSVADFPAQRPEPVATSDPFAFQNELALDEMYAPLIYLMEAAERGVYDDLSVDGKRNFLRRFWESRDPSPGTTENEEMSRFYAAIDYANDHYSEGGAAGIDGWRTDRGRIFLKYGVPDEFLDEAGSGATKPYIVWKFTRGRPLKFIFIDPSGLGHYEMVFTDDRSEQSRMDWQSLFEQNELERVLRF